MKAGTFTEATRKASAAERAKVQVWARKWQHEFYLHMLRIDVLFHDTASKDDESPSMGACAQINTELAGTYHVATLNIFPRFFADNDDEDQEFMIAHELAHVVTHPLASLVARQAAGQLITPEELRRDDEAVTDHVARIAFYGGNSKERSRPLKPGAIKAKLRK